MYRDHPHKFVFYAPQLDHDSQHVNLTDNQHHHLKRVLRMSVGDTVFVSNGSGLIAQCVIDTVLSGSTRLTVGGTIEDRTGSEPVTLALGCLKKEAFETAIRQCTEVGVTEFLPFASAKSHVKEYSGVYLGRLRRLALASMKQSFRSVLPTVQTPISFAALVERARDLASVVVGESSAPPFRVCERPGPLMIVIGPEGGFVTEETEQLRAAGCELGSVSAHRLRSETAAVALTSFVTAQGSPVADTESNSIDTD